MLLFVSYIHEKKMNYKNEAKLKNNGGKTMKNLKAHSVHKASMMARRFGSWVESLSSMKSAIAADT